MAKPQQSAKRTGWPHAWYVYFRGTATHPQRGAGGCPSASWIPTTRRNLQSKTAIPPWLMNHEQALRQLMHLVVKTPHFADNSDKHDWLIQRPVTNVSWGWWAKQPQAVGQADMLQTFSNAPTKSRAGLAGSHHRASAGDGTSILRHNKGRLVVRFMQIPIGRH